LNDIAEIKIQDCGKKFQLSPIVVLMRFVEIAFQQFSIDTTATLWYLLE
jgi:hypothetical protein